jgi:diguanylate cyclase (GGDEF)-like protein
VQGSRRQDIVLVVTLIAFGLSLLGVAYLSAHLFQSRVLRTEADAAVERWRATAGELLDVEGEALAARAFQLRAVARREGVLEFAVTNRDGRVVVAERIEREGELRGAVGAAEIDSGALATALSGGDTGVQRAEADGMVLHDAVVAVKADGAVAGALHLVVDQSATARVLSTTLGVVSTSTALLVWLAFFIPAVIVWRRIKERIAAEKRIHHMAHHDGLTDLPNRALLADRLDRALTRAQRHGSRIAVLYLDLDKFKMVNDTLGHHVGDELLKSVARRVEDTIRDTDTVGRLGGDEFAIVAEDVKSMDDVVILARRLCEVLAQAHDIGGHSVVAAASIGIAMTPDDGLEREILLKNADLALYRAKAEGRGTFRFFEARMDAELQERRDIERDLKLALLRDEFTLHYQPQHDLQRTGVVGYEALMRWRHPIRGEIPPATFIGVAEQAGIITEIGEWVLRTACREASRWEEPVKVAVNLSPAQFRKNDVASSVERILGETGLDPHRLELEITETLLLQNTDFVLDQLNRLRALGVSIAMDDFGTGYSSLSYLARFPFDKIKIDRSFTRSVDKDHNVQAIVTSIIGLGSTLSMTITAEGVETAEQAEALRRAGVDQVQGYLYGYPTPATETAPEKRAAA